LAASKAPTGIAKYVPSLAWPPVEVGLYTALVPMLVYPLLGTSQPPGFSVTSTIAMQSATVLASVVPDGDG
jgi:SulP family sulfate permease